MDKLYLPYIQGTDTIQTALERLKQTDSRAIIVSLEPGVHRLYMNTDIVDAWKENVNFCSELSVSKGKPVALLTVETSNQKREMALTVTAAKDAGSLPELEDISSLSENDLEEELDQYANDYGILSLPDDSEIESSVLVITRHEGLKRHLEYAAKVCVCSGASRHTKNGSPPNTGDKCNTCGHRYTCY